MGRFCARTQVTFPFFSNRIFLRAFSFALVVILVQVAGKSAQAAPPAFTSFSCVNEGGGDWILEGQIEGGSPDDPHVYFSGLVTGSATIGADGTFSYSFTLPPMAAGYIYAQVTNQDGAAFDNEYVSNF
jgi:hypothetical protein